MTAVFPKIRILMLLVVCAIAACNPGSRKEKEQVSDLLPQSLHDLTNVIIHDIFSPPVASRIYAYASLAYYEGLKGEDPRSPSLTQQLQGFEAMPRPEKGKSYHYPLVAFTAFHEVAQNLVFSKDSLKEKERIHREVFQHALEDDVYENSVRLGKAIAGVIIRRSLSDNYKKSRGMPRFSVYKSKGKWQQTSPDYNDAVEPYWNSITPLLLDSAAQFKPAPPPPYSLEKESLYYKELMEVYTVSNTLTPEMDTIARFWDDNSFVTTHQGHLMFGNKKTTPVGHWMSIASILCARQKVSRLAAARIYALTACAIYDGFIACWDEKYRSSTVRPITVIQEEMDPEWSPLLQTPPFPEYTSGHSVISQAAATVLTHYLGHNIAFTDTTEMEYLGLKRQFSSIQQAADEAGISRLYGGIHFRSAIAQGGWQGKQVGNLYIATFP
ncbi:MAG TPA: vanadium-dependent haloperoxidase [Chitinophagaceae bacterium]|jgi:hypothetical protein|nr:vanadium-dependent haloperoxidase [Chitinophagaceae bacterium]